jgi:hypothetical protein
MNKISKILTVAGAGALLVGAGAFVGSQAFPKTVEVQKDVIVEKTVFVDKLVPVEVIKEVKVTEAVDNGKLDLVLQEIYDNDGSVEYLIDDLKDDEVDLIADRIILVNDFKDLAIAELRKNLFDELDGEVVGSETLDEGDMERLRINDDANEIVIDDIDFDDKDADLILTGTFEQDDIKYAFEATVSFKDGEVDEIDSVSVSLD